MIEPTAIPFSIADYIVTQGSGNIISKSSQIYGLEAVIVGGQCVIEEGAIIRGDLGEIELGMNCFIGKNAVLRPSTKVVKGSVVYFPMIIGSNVIIEEECIVKCLSIGSNVCIGKGSILSDKCIIYDNSYILPGSVLPAGTVVAPFTVYGGSPAAPASQLTESFTELQQALARTYYSRYKQTDGVSLQSSSK